MPAFNTSSLMIKAKRMARSSELDFLRCIELDFAGSDRGFHIVDDFPQICHQIDVFIIGIVGDDYKPNRRQMRVDASISLSLNAGSPTAFACRCSMLDTTCRLFFTRWLTSLSKI